MSLKSREDKNNFPKDFLIVVQHLKERNDCMDRLQVEAALPERGGKSVLAGGNVA